MSLVGNSSVGGLTSNKGVMCGKVPFLVVGILLIIFGFYLDLSAKYKSKLFQNVEENRLITDGVYAYTRNPVYLSWRRLPLL